METTIIPLKQICEKGAWHFPLFSAEARDAEAALQRSPYPHVPLKELVLKTARGFPGIGGGYSEGTEIPLLSVSSITAEGIDIEMSNRFISKDDHDKLSKSATEPGDVLVPLILGSRENIAAVYESDQPANLTPHLVLLRLRESRVDPHYLAAFLNSSLGRSLIAHRTTGSIQRSLTMSRLLDLPIPLPPLAEQIAMVARYLTSFSGSERSLVRRVKRFLDSLDAVYDGSFRVNPVNNQRIAQAEIAQNYELSLTIAWLHPLPNPALLSFDVESATDIYLPHLSNLVAVPAKQYFGDLTLVYSSFGRARDLVTFPLLFDLENVIKELIIATMLSSYGDDWWDTAGIDQNLRNSAAQYRNNEASNPLHDSFEFHPVFYLDLKDLRKIIEDENDKHTQQGHPLNSPFTAVFAHYDQVHMPDKIGEIRDLRNRVMHGKYLTENNLLAIRVICSQFHRFLVAKGYVGDFRERKLTEA
jgi:hypothetical protein